MEQDKAWAVAAVKSLLERAVAALASQLREVAGVTPSPPASTSPNRCGDA
jgi:hypothetical protein